MPGKKLPIWKKRTSLPAAAAVIAPTPTSIVSSPPEPEFISPDVSTPLQGPDLSELTLTPVSGPPPGAKLVPVSNISASSIIASPGVVASRAYSRQSPGGDGTAKLPSKIRELQENLNFEKIRRTGVKNAKGGSATEWAEVAGSNDEVTKDMTVEEMREFMEEQRKRLSQLGEEDDDDDYYDNDAGLPDDDYPEEDDIAATPSSEASPARPILKHERKGDEMTPASAPRKSVRFSLRPGTVPTPQNIDAPDKPPQEKPMSPPKKRGRPPATASTAESRTLLQETLDNTVDLFNQAVEEEDKNNFEETRQTQQTSPGAKRGRGRPSKKLVKADAVTPPAKRRRVTAPKENGSSSGSSNHSKLVMEVLRKNPDLFKKSKQVQLKVMAKDASGKAVMKYITLKAADKEVPPQRENTSMTHISSL